MCEHHLRLAYGKNLRIDWIEKRFTVTFNIHIYAFLIQPVSRGGQYRKARGAQKKSQGPPKAAPAGTASQALVFISIFSAAYGWL